VATFHDQSNGTYVGGTIEMRSTLNGSDGTISVAGDEDVLKGLGFSILRDAREDTFTVTVSDAHDATKIIASDVQVTGHKLIGIVQPNVDVLFEGTGTYYLHLADNTTVFQIGANEGEDMGINIGDMRSEALALNKVLVTDRESAARSITIIDSAIDKVSMQRAKLGAYQNRLEHTITNLTVAGENLTAAESRIRDTYMAKEMMNFTKLQIMLQAGTSMLAQANTLPQNVLSLLR
jgi:flagellin